MTKLEKANEYIKENMHKVNSRPLMHLTPEIGWLNDPNGFSYFKNKYHLFYQYYPYDTRWNDMHWGHATSDDLIKWEYQPVALANDTIADANGCFSGSAIEKDENLYLLYTGLINPNMGFDFNENEVLQQQCLAVSKDGINFEKHKNNPVISQYDLPNGYRKADFRDPKVIKKEDTYYTVIVAKNEMGRGDILLYSSLDLINWKFISAIYKSKIDENIMYECPDLFTLNGKDVIVVSIMPCDGQFEEEVGNKTEYIIGELDYSTGVYKVEKRDILDYGNSFYAPQTMEDNNNNRIVVGWMKKWVNKSITIPDEYGWNGMMSLPRKLSLEANNLIQTPVSTIEKYMSTVKEITSYSLNDIFTITTNNSNTFNFRCIINTDNDNTITYELFKNDKDSIKIIIELKENRVSYVSDFDNISETHELNTNLLKENQLILDLYIDEYTMELFINKGEKVLSFTSFNTNKGTEFNIQSKKEATMTYAEINQINVE